MLDKYDKLRQYQVPFLRCGKTVIPTTTELPGFLQAALFLTKNIKEVRGSKQVKIALKDVNKWIKYLREEGETISKLDEWQFVANLLQKNLKE